MGTFHDQISNVGSFQLAVLGTFWYVFNKNVSGPTSKVFYPRPLLCPLKSSPVPSAVSRKKGKNASIQSSNMRSLLVFITLLAATSASIFLPTTISVRSLADIGRSSPDVAFHRRRNANRVLKTRPVNADGKPLAIAIPGNSVAEQVVIGGEILICHMFIVMFI